MKDYSARVRRLELKTGTVEEKDYTFIQISSFSLERFHGREEPYFKKSNFVGTVQIWKNLSKKYERNIDTGSQEGLEILRNHGYEIIYPSAKILEGIKA